MDYLNLLVTENRKEVFSKKSHKFPVCARCTGFYTGLILYLTCKLLFDVNFTSGLFIIATIILIPTGIDGFSQYLGYRESTNKIRFFTGIIGGIIFSTSMR